MKRAIVRTDFFDLQEGVDRKAGDAFIPKTPQEKAMQRALLQYFKPQKEEESAAKKKRG